MMSTKTRSSTDRLVLGTAQLGMFYGIANKTGQPNQEIASKIIREAWDGGIKEFDTAQAYENSEVVLGKAFTDLGITEQVQVITKLSPYLNDFSEKNLREALIVSINRLQIPQLYGIMLHQEETLSMWDQDLQEIFEKLITSGLVEHVGVSVYSPEKALWGLETEGIDFIQLPSNFLDKRFENAGIFQLAQKKKKKIYIRSIFLQGLILMTPENVPRNMSYAKPIIEQIQTICQESSFKPQEIALGFVKKNMPKAQIIFGAETPWQVRDNLKFWSASLPLPLFSHIKSVFSQVNEEILNPALWPK